MDENSMAFGVAHDKWLDANNPYVNEVEDPLEDEAPEGFEWCPQCGEPTWNIEDKQCERRLCRFID